MINISFTCLHFLLLTSLSEELKFKKLSLQNRHNLLRLFRQVKISARQAQVMHIVGASKKSLIPSLQF